MRLNYEIVIALKGNIMGILEFEISKYQFIEREADLLSSPPVSFVLCHALCFLDFTLGLYCLWRAVLCPFFFPINKCKTDKKLYQVMNYIFRNKRTSS